MIWGQEARLEGLSCRFLSFIISLIIISFNHTFFLQYDQHNQNGQDWKDIHASLSPSSFSRSAIIPSLTFSQSSYDMELLNVIIMLIIVHLFKSRHSSAWVGILERLWQVVSTFDIYILPRFEKWESNQQFFAGFTTAQAPHSLSQSTLCSQILLIRGMLRCI